jgi:hypothetical protein
MYISEATIFIFFQEKVRIKAERLAMDDIVLTSPE